MEYIVLSIRWNCVYGEKGKRGRHFRVFLEDDPERPIACVPKKEGVSLESSRKCRFWSRALQFIYVGASGNQSKYQ